MKVKSLSPVQLLATPWAAAHQAPTSMGFSRQEYWGELPCPSLVITSRIFFFLGKPLKIFIKEMNLSIVFCSLQSALYTVSVGFSLTPLIVGPESF